MGVISWLSSRRKVLPAPVFHATWNGAWKLFWWKEEYRESVRSKTKVQDLRLSERGVLTETILTAYPFKRMLEVGFGAGQQLHLLAPLLGDVEIVAIDKNQTCVKQVPTHLSQEGIKNVTILEMDASNLGAFPNRSFEIVYTAASLLYVRADQIEQIAKEMVRVCSRKIILLEQHVENPRFPGQALGVLVRRSGDVSGFWVRDYCKLFERIVPGAKIEIQRVPKAQWPMEQWKESGCVIEVNL